MSEPTRPAVSSSDAGPGPDTLPVDSVPTAVSLERRTVLRAAGVAGVAGAVGVGLAACSSSGSNTGATGGTSAPATSAPAAATSAAASASPSASAAGGGSGTALGASSQIPVGSGMIFSAQKVVVTQPTAGTFKGFSSTCTHMGCQVSQISGGLIHCPCHGSEYSIVDGSVKGGPAPMPLPAENITVQGGQIFLAS
jgi:Rieske Fe-S protein